MTEDRTIDFPRLMQDLEICRAAKACHGDAHYFQHSRMDGMLCLCGDRKLVLPGDGRALIVEADATKHDN